MNHDLRMVLSDRDVGRMAESLVQLWAAQHGFIANKAYVDATGWDYLLEFDRPSARPAALRSLDHEPSADASLVQVKGTDSGTSVAIKLDNMKRLIDWPIPTFIFIAVYDGAADPKATYLVPVDEELTRRVLERLRSVPDDQQDRLHAMTLSVTWEDRHRLVANDGGALRDAVALHVGKDPAAYAARKLKWKETLGYGERPYRGRLVFKEKDPNKAERHMVSFAIGLTDRLEASVIDICETRFGITKPLPHIEQDTFLKLDTLPKAGTAVINVRSKKKAAAVNLECTYYDPRILFPGIQTENLRFRFAAEHVDFILHFDLGRWDFSFDLPALDEVVSLESAAKAIDLLFMLEDASTDELELSMSLNGGKMNRAGFDPQTLKLNRIADPATRTAFQAASDAWKIAQYVDLERPTRMRLERLVEHAEPLHVGRMLVDPAMFSSFEINGVIPGAPTGRLGYPIVAGGNIGDAVVIVGAAVGGVPNYTGDVTEHGSKFTIKMPSIQVVVKEVIPVKGTGSVAMAPYFQQLRDWMEEHGMDLLPAEDTLPK